MEKLDEIMQEREMFEELSNEIIPMNVENVLELSYDKRQFKAGIESVSYLAGQVTSLINTGISEDAVLTIITGLMNKDSLEKQFEVEERLANVQASAVETKEL